ncbi:ethanolamine utilization protein EutH [Lacrimispora indolis]|nr:ethanolamine utilization protein EutH [[Clostridium] methoxybenzovorans]
MISQIIVYIMVIFMAVAAIDRMFGNRLGLGQEFEEGFNAMGALTLGMAGIMVTVDLIGAVLTPTVGALFSAIGADPSMAGSLILSIDTGGYALAHAIQPNNADIANFSAIILASMMGPTIAFGIPVCLGIMQPSDKRFLAIGTMSGIVCIPFACIVGGLVAGFDIGMVLINMVPVLIFAVLIALGLKFIPTGMIKGFNIFAKFMIAYLSFFLGLAIVQELTPIHLIELRPLSEVWGVIGSIAMMLAGAYPLVKVLTKVLGKPLGKLGAMIGINDVAVAGLIACCANSIPAYSMLKDMDNKGKVINIAFACCAAFALGDHLGFCAGVEPDLIAAMVAAKLFGGVFCVLSAIFFMNLDKKQLEDIPEATV